MPTFDDIDNSAALAQPAELYEIRYSGQQWLYTSSDEAITRDYQTYEPLAIRRDATEEGSPTTKSTCQVRMPDTVPCALIFKIRPPSELVMLTIWEIDLAHPEAGSRVVWKGRVINCFWGAEGEITLSAESVFSSLRRTGLRKRHQVRCHHDLYGAGCRLNEGDFRETYTLGAYAGGITLPIPGISGKPTNYFAGGFLTWYHNIKNNMEKIMIRSSSGTNVVVAGLPQGLVPGAELFLYRGCDHTLTGGCTQLNNTKNYGGMWYLPRENPFDGTSLF